MVSGVRLLFFSCSALALVRLLVGLVSALVRLSCGAWLGSWSALGRLLGLVCFWAWGVLGLVFWFQGLGCRSWCFRGRLLLWSCFLFFSWSLWSCFLLVGAVVSVWACLVFSCSWFLLVLLFSWLVLVVLLLVFLVGVLVSGGGLFFFWSWCFWCSLGLFFSGLVLVCFRCWAPSGLKSGKKTHQKIFVKNSLKNKGLNPPPFLKKFFCLKCPLFLF